MYRSFFLFPSTPGYTGILHPGITVAYMRVDGCCTLTSTEHLLVKRATYAQVREIIRILKPKRLTARLFFKKEIPESIKQSKLFD